MKKTVKIILFSIIGIMALVAAAVVIFFIYVGAKWGIEYNNYLLNNPSRQYDTTWVTADGSYSFYVPPLGETTHAHDKYRSTQPFIPPDDGKNGLMHFDLQVVNGGQKEEWEIVIWRAGNVHETLMGPVTSDEIWSTWREVDVEEDVYRIRCNDSRMEQFKEGDILTFYKVKDQN